MANLFDKKSAKDLLEAAKAKAAEALGEEGIEALKGLKDSVADLSNTVKTTAQRAIDESDNELVGKARTLLNKQKAESISVHGADASFVTNEAPKSSVRAAPAASDAADRSEKKTSLVPAICTQCGAALEVDPSTEAAVCRYCGAAFIVDKAINEYNIRADTLQADTVQANIRADKVEVHKKGGVEATLDYLQKKREFRAEQMRKQQEESKKLLPYLLVALVIIMGLLFWITGSDKRKSDAEEQRLQSIVVEIQSDIDEGRYDEAMVKANGLYYTSGYSSETKKKWDNTRESLIGIINDKKNDGSAGNQSTGTGASPGAGPSETQNPQSAGNSAGTAGTGQSSSSGSGNSHKIKYHSSHDRATAQEGNTGIYAYESVGRTATDTYFIIDFDEGYVYFLSAGNDNPVCVRMKMIQGDLNDVLIISYYDGDTKALYGLHFWFQYQPTELIVQDENGDESEYSAADLEKVLKLRDEKTIVDF